MEFAARKNNNAALRPPWNRPAESKSAPSDELLQGQPDAVTGTEQQRAYNDNAGRVVVHAPTFYTPDESVRTKRQSVA